MEKWEYLIRVLNYRKADLENELTIISKWDVYQINEVEGEIAGINFALTEIYKLVQGME